MMASSANSNTAAGVDTTDEIDIVNPGASGGEQATNCSYTQPDYETRL
jgi:hypothetical protein